MQELRLSRTTLSQRTDERRIIAVFIALPTIWADLAVPLLRCGCSLLAMGAGILTGAVIGILVCDPGMHPIERRTGFIVVAH